MRERHDTVIIGGGQAGLAMSYYLREQSREHIILERSQIAERWRSERWDSLSFQFPNWGLKLPGFPYSGPDPHAFARRDEVVQFITDYARLIDAPVRLGTNVVLLEHDTISGYFVITTPESTIEARRAVIATGPFQKPVIPPTSTLLPPAMMQLHARDYVNPLQLPPGAILVVGAGSSGCQIVEELYHAGRTVYFSVSCHRRAPRRYRGRDACSWLLDMGRFDTTIDSLPRRQIPPPLVLTGVDGGHDIDLRQFAADGVILLGRYQGSSDDELRFADDLEQIVAYADRSATEFVHAVDEYARTLGASSSEANSISEVSPIPPTPLKRRDALNLKAEGITTVIWCTGYTFDFDWARLPIFDHRGAPVQQRGVTTCPGAYVLGLHWMHTFKSGTLFGVGEDAAFIAQHIAVNAGASDCGSFPAS